MRRIVIIASFIILSLVGNHALAFKYATEAEKRKAFLKELEGNIEKVDASIKLIKTQIEEARDAPYVPDLYFRLAELYVEKSRYLFFKKREENPGQPIKIKAAPQVMEAKTQALEVYQGLLTDFPRYRNNDRVRFFMAHEYRELGRVDDMLNQYRTIIRDYKKSTYRGEAYLLLGDYHFDRRELKEARQYYRTVTKLPESKVHNMARYKLAWVYINEDNNKLALRYFEDIAKSGNTFATSVDKGSTINIIREALIDSILCYTEVKAPTAAIAYYRRLADSEATYIKVLSRLANRYYIRKQLRDSARLYREVLKINPNIEESREQLARLFEYTRTSKDISNASTDIELLVSHMSRYLHSWRIGEKERLEAYNNFERSARDIATKLDKRARGARRVALYHQTTKAYKQYLSIFGDSSFAKEMQTNFAEALYAAGDYVKAGKEYEKIVKNADEKDRKELLNSAIFAYFEALKETDSLSRVELIDARRGFISAGSQFAEQFPGAKETPNLMFSVARSYYDLADYDKAIKAFATFIDRFPDHSKTAEAGHLALDSYNFKKDFDGLIKFGKGLIAKRSINDRKFKSEIKEIVQQAEFKSIEKLASLTNKKGTKGAEQFIEFAKQYKRSDLGEKALYNAFVTAKKADNPNLIQRSGEELLAQFPRSAFLKDVYPTLGNMALQTGEYDQAARYFETYADKFSQKRESSNLLYNAATIQRLLSNYGRSIDDFEKVLRNGKRADLNEVRWQLALTYEEAGDWNRVAAVLQKLMAGGRVSVEVLFKLGEAYTQMGRRKQAKQQYVRALSRYKKLRPASRKQTEIDAAAGAQFRLMERAAAAFERIRVRSGVPEEQVVQKKSNSLANLEKSVQKVSRYGSAKWGIAAIYKIAQEYNHFANFLSKTSVPAGLSPAEKKQYRALLNKQIKQFRAQAKQTFRAAVANAHKANIFDDYVKSCLAEELVENTPPDRVRARLDSKAVKRRDGFRNALLKNPRNIEALNGLGKLYLQAGDYHIARLVFLRAVELGSRSWQTYNGLGVCLWYLEEHQQAYFQFKKAWNLSKAAQPALNLAALYKEYANNARSNSLVKNVGKVKKSALRSADYLPTVQKLYS